MFEGIPLVKSTTDNSFNQVITRLAIKITLLLTIISQNWRQLWFRTKAALVGWVSEGCQDEQILRNLAKRIRNGSDLWAIKLMLDTSVRQNTFHPVMFHNSSLPKWVYKFAEDATKIWRRSPFLANILLRHNNLASHDTSCCDIQNLGGVWGWQRGTQGEEDWGVLCTIAMGCTTLPLPFPTCRKMWTS